jgi:Tfp pilus assembly protein PilF
MAAFKATLLAAFAAAAFAGSALAQNNPNARSRESSAQTVIGAPNAAQCAAAAGAGRSDDEALAACDKAIKQDRLNRANMVTTLTNRGALHLRRKAGEAALADFDKALALDKKNTDVMLNRGAALVMVGKPGLAVAAITEALGLGVREPHKAYFNRGSARESLGDLRGAYEDYDTALQIKPDWEVAEAELARFVKGRRDRLAAALGSGGAAPAPKPEGESR